MRAGFFSQQLDETTRQKFFGPRVDAALMLCSASWLKVFRQASFFFLLSYWTERKHRR